MAQRLTEIEDWLQLSADELQAWQTQTDRFLGHLCEQLRSQEVFTSLQERVQAMFPSLWVELSAE